MTHLDTSFLVDLVREATRAERGPATRCLVDLGDQELGVSPFVACELRAGAEQARDAVIEHRRVDALLAPLARVAVSEDLPSIYGRLLAALKAQGQTISTMDLLIAAVAIGEGAALVTRNTRHFERVPGLQLIGY